MLRKLFDEFEEKVKIYIIKDNSDNTLFAPHVGQIVTQRWSDGSTFSKTF